MRGCYTAGGKVAGVNAAKTLLYGTVAANKLLKLFWWSVTNESNSTNYQFQAAAYYITTLGTPAGTTVTPTPTEPGDQAATTTVKIAPTSEPTTYGNMMIQGGGPSLTGFAFDPNAEQGFFFVNGGASGASFGVRLITTPLSSTDLDVMIGFAEVG